MNPSRPPAAIAIALAACVALSAAAQPAYHPRVEKLSPADLVFRQLQDSIAQGYRAEYGVGQYPDLFICSWTATAGEDLFTVAARLSLPYETVATLNGWDHPRAIPAGTEVLLPSMAGLFIRDEPRTDLERLLRARLPPGTDGSMTVRAGGSDWRFYPGVRLYGTERSFFLNVGFRMPLSEGALTSGFGFRASPIDGHDRMHEGIDLAAPAGSEVMASRAGTVTYVGDDPVLGLHVVIAHEGGMTTVYGHLSTIRVVLNQTVLSGTIVGTVGSTGLSTGPHLHFEIRVGGSARDPASYLHGLSP